MTDRTAPSSDARKRNAERVTYTLQADTSQIAEAFKRMAEQVDAAATRKAARGVSISEALDQIKARFPRPDQEPDMTAKDRHDELVAPTDHRANAERALSTIDASDDPRNLPAGLDGIGSALLALHDLLDERLPKPRKVDPELVARNLDAIKHELETPMREHGECCEPAPADDLPGEPVEPGDLRAGDRVAFTYRWKRYEGALVGSTRRRVPPTSLELAGLMVTFEGGWAGDISDVRLIERAPREDEDPDEALAKVLWEVDITSVPWDETAAFDRVDYFRMARAAREHLNPDGIDWESTLSGVVQDRDAAIDRAEKAEADLAEWREVAARYEDGRDKWQAKWRESDEARERAEAERDALRERLDALRADIRQDRLMSSTILYRDDERAAAIERDDERAKGEQR